MSVTGLYAAPVLDGQPLASVSAEEVAIRGRALRTLRTAASGAVRAGLTYLGPDMSLARRRRAWDLRYQHTGALTLLLARLLADPGPHTWIVWRPETLAYAADGTRREWLLPWPLGLDFTSPPQGRPSEPLEAQVIVGLAGAPLAVEHQPTAAYDAGDPAAGEVWFEETGARWKLAAPPAAGVLVYVTVVPRYTVFEAAEELEQQFRGPIREPQDVRLVEA